MAIIISDLKCAEHDIDFVEGYPDWYPGTEDGTWILDPAHLKCPYQETLECCFSYKVKAEDGSWEHTVVEVS